MITSAIGPRLRVAVLNPLVAPFAGPLRVWLLTIALGVAAALGYAAVIAGLAQRNAPLDLEWWVMALGFGLAEVLVVHLQFRHDTHSFSLSEVALVVGLFFVRPDRLVLGLVVGTALALAVHRRQPILKLTFNLANLALTTELAIVLFRAILGPNDPLGAMGWAAAFGAAIVADVLSLLMITLAISLATGQRPEFGKLLGSGTVASFFNTCVGLLVVTVLWIRPESVWLPLVQAGMMYGAYRIYGTVRQKHESLEVLYESTRLLQGSTDANAMFAMLLGQAREMFRASQAEILLLPAERDAGLEVSMAAGGEIQTTVLDSIDPTEGVWARVASEGRGVCLGRPIANDRLRSHFARRAMRDAMVAPLFAQDAVIGTMLVANRKSDVSTFTAEDLQLFETFANHASAALENVRLIDRLQRHAAETEYRALHDALTSLPNRTLFRQQLDAAVAESGASSRIAVLLMDLDRFKEVNDTLGHHNGDLLLQAVAGRLREALRPGDVVARLGGDEFGILLRNVGDRRGVNGLADRILATFTDPFTIQELTLDVGATIGIALYPDHGSDVDTLIQRADVAMYRAKSEVGGHEIYAPEHDSYSPARLVLLGELRRAIDDGNLSVVYQPKVDVADGRILGAEALVRWRHDRRGLIAPDEFVPVAEHTGLLKPLTLRVLDIALEQCSRWRAGGFELSVAVNLSVRNLLDVELPDDVAAMLDRWSLPPSALELEITESTLIADPARTERVLQRLHDVGVAIAIDDFGTGYSSLSYLRRMPVDELKIDKSFVTRMGRDEGDEDALIVRSTIELGKNLGLRVVAEGVETREVWKQLSALGCDVAQGYYFGRPVSADAFLSHLTSSGLFATGVSRRDRQRATRERIAVVDAAG